MGGVAAVGRVVDGRTEKGTSTQRDTVIEGGKEGGKDTERGQTAIVGGATSKEVGAANDHAHSPGIRMAGIWSARARTRTAEKHDVPVPSIQTTNAPPHQAKRHPGDSKKTCTLHVIIGIGHRTDMAYKAQITWRVGVCKERLPPSVSGHLHPNGLRGNCHQWDPLAGNPNATAQKHPATWTLIPNLSMTGGVVSVKNANVESTGKRQRRKDGSMNGHGATKAAVTMLTGAPGSQGARARVNNLAVPVRAGRRPLRQVLRKRSGLRSPLLLRLFRRLNRRTTCHLLQPSLRAWVQRQHRRL